MSKELIKRILSSIVLLPLFLYIVFKGSYFFTIFILLCFFISIYEWNRMKITFLKKIIGLIFLIFSFYSIYKIRNYLSNDNWIFLLIFFSCIFTDIGGYFFGKLLKGPKLTKLSPNKTFAGMFGSYMFCFLLYIICLNLNIIDKNYQLNALIFIFLISSVSQLGDILISYFKRLSNIKDTGKIIPGHGGILDRIDGMIFAFPISYLLLSINYFKNLI